MYGEAKKLHLIEQMLKIENDTELDELGIFMNQQKIHVANRTSFKEFAGMMSDKEVDELENIIEEGCETVPIPAGCLPNNAPTAPVCDATAAQ